MPMQEAAGKKTITCCNHRCMTVCGTFAAGQCHNRQCQAPESAEIHFWMAAAHEKNCVAAKRATRAAGQLEGMHKQRDHKPAASQPSYPCTAIDGYRWGASGPLLASNDPIGTHEFGVCRAGGLGPMVFPCQVVGLSARALSEQRQRRATNQNQSQKEKIVGP